MELKDLMKASSADNLAAISSMRVSSPNVLGGVQINGDAGSTATIAKLAGKLVVASNYIE